MNWDEILSDISLTSDATTMMHGSGSLDTLRFALSRKLVRAPGTVFNDSTGDSTVLSAILQKVTDGQIRNFFQRNIFAKIGLAEPIWEEDRAGNLIGGASLFLTAPDLAKLGQMMLRHGNGPNGIVVSEDSANLLVSPAVLSDPQAYGYLWWLNAADPSNAASESNPFRFPSATSKTFAALGQWGQALVVVPEEDLIIVRLADDKGSSFDLDGLIARASLPCPGLEAFQGF